MIKKAVWILGLLLAALPAYSEGYTLKVDDKAPPEEASDEVKAQLVEKSYQISDDAGVFFEFWFVQELKLSGFGETTKDSLKNLEEIALIGVAVVHENEEEYTDFRDDPIDPGLYIMRMALQPQDGNHMGTSPFDSFAILISYEKDGDVLEFMDPEEMVDIASEDTPADHPPILSLQPADDMDGDFPRMEENEEEEWHFLSIKIPAKAGDEHKDLRFNLVVVGIGEL